MVRNVHDPSEARPRVVRFALCVSKFEEKKNAITVAVDAGGGESLF